MSIANERFDVLLQSDGMRRIAPTDLALHQHLDGCQRFLRLRLFEHNTGTNALASVMRRHHIAVQSPSPLPAILGQQFEQRINTAMAETGWSVAALGGIDALHNDELVRLIHELAPAQGVFVLQPNIEVVIGQWRISGRPDMVRIQRQADGRIHVLVTDIKSAFAVKPEHRTQVALYHAMLDSVLQGIGDYTMVTSILHQYPHQPPRDSATHQQLAMMEQAAQTWYGMRGVCLDVLANPLQLRDDVSRLLAFDPRSPLIQCVSQRFSELPYAISRACESCRYMEVCLTDSAQRQDVALIPLIDRESRRMLRHHGVQSVAQVATLKHTTPQRTLTPNPDAPSLHALSRDPVVGPWLDHWIVRAQQLQKQHDTELVVAHYPEQTVSTLPRINDKNPTAVILYLDVHVDHFAGLVWQCGGLLDYYLNGASYAQYHAVELSPTPPTTLADEHAVLRRWLTQLQGYWDAHIRNTDTTHTVPLHCVVYDAAVWVQLIDALGRHYHDDPMCRAWHDYLTTPRWHDAPLYTVLAEEMRHANRLNTTVPSLMALASMQGFAWKDDHYNYRALFQYQHFDASGRLDDGSTYYIQRARFSSTIPLEYAYAAWQALPARATPTDDAFARFRHMTTDMLTAYGARRLHAMAHLTKRVGRWWNNRCDAVDIRTLHHTHAAPTQLSGVLSEYMECERQAELAEWRRAHEPSIRARVCAGTSLLVEFRMAWQSQATQLQLAHLRKAQHDTLSVPMNKIVLVVQVCADADTPTVAQQFELNALASETSAAMLNPLTTEAGKPLWVDQLIQQGMRVKITQRDLDTGRLTLEVESMQTDVPYSYGGRMFIPSDETCYVLDSAPDNVPARITNRAVQRVIQDASANTLYRHLTGVAVTTTPLDRTAMQGYIQACDIHGPHFQGDARTYVAEYHDAPLLLVQGPPGTGKTFTTAHAVLARIYAAMCAQRPLRIAISCQTHAAINELLQKLADVKAQLATTAPAIAQVLHRLALVRYRRPDSDDTATGVQFVADKGQMIQILRTQQWCVVGATPTSLETLVQDAGAWSDILILDEASQMSVPHALIAARVLMPTGMMIVVGDPRQMPVIVAHDWANNRRQSFVRYPVYRSLFDYLLAGAELFGYAIPMARLATSHRVPPQLADFLRHEIYQHDGIAYHSRQSERMRVIAVRDGFAAAALHSDYPIVLIEHDESASRSSNLFEARLVTNLLVPLIQARYDARRGFGVVVPHRMQRSTIKTMLKPHMPARDDMLIGEVEVAGVDTVERYQGSERDVMIVSATESDSDYIRRNESFLFDMRRLNVALSRARHKVIVVASEQVLDYMASDANVALQSQIWKNLRRYWCTDVLYEAIIAGRRVRVSGLHTPPTPITEQ